MMLFNKIKQLPICLIFGGAITNKPSEVMLGLLACLIVLNFARPASTIVKVGLGVVCSVSGVMVIQGFDAIFISG